MAATSCIYASQAICCCISYEVHLLAVTVTEAVLKTTAFGVEILVLGVRYRMPGGMDFSTDLF
jgi:hypothetical protein